MMDFFKKYQFPLFLGLAGVLTLITYGVLIPQLGYYQDDWYLIWSGQARGIPSIIDLFATDRPFMGYVYAFDYSVIGNNLMGWHLLALGLKLVGVYAVIWLLRMLWPREKFMLYATTIIFIVYPGFLSQPIANTFQNHLLTYHAAILSIAFGVAAIKSDRTALKWLLAILSVGLTAFYEPIYEYMIGLEGVKIVFFWVAIHVKEDIAWKKVTIKTGFWYLPHAIVSAIFVYWRFFIFQSSRPTTDQVALLSDYQSNPIRAFAYLSLDVFKDFLDTVVHAWSVPIYRLFATALYSDLIEALLWAGLAVTLVLGYLFFVNAQSASNQEDEPRSKFIWLGLWIILVTLLPMIFAGREVLYDGFERYTLQTTLGVGLLIGAVLTYIHPKMRYALLLALVFIGVSTHIMNARKWVTTWETHQDIYWQFAWRVPAFEEDTLVVFSNFSVEQDYEVWAPLNMIYAPEAPLPYVDAELLYSGAVTDIVAGAYVEDGMRDFTLTKNYSQVIVAVNPYGGGCLQLLDGRLPIISTETNSLVQNVAPYSDLTQIITDASAMIPPVEIFGEEPAHAWCYYYQKISLARQNYDWNTVLDWYQQASAENLKPLDKVEWFPIVEAYVMTSEVELARNPASIIRSDRDLKVQICTLLEDQMLANELEGNYDFATMLDLMCTEW